jgi:hypothetical protein
MWSEPPDLNGFLASSEKIPRYNLETEIANDFIPTEPWVTRVAWWGGYYNNNDPCIPGIPASPFNLRFYETASCLPGNLIAEIVDVTPSEELLICQEDLFPIYQYEIDLLVEVPPANRCWFSAQMSEHDFPPQWGRLSSLHVVECESAFRSMFWGYPDWVPVSVADPFGLGYDLSQEFEGDHPEACCFPDGHCELVLTSICRAQGGDPQGPDSGCDPDPCGSTPAKRSTWGSVRALYR